MRALAPLAFAAFVLLLPELALACPVCGQAKEESRVAFVLTTGVLSFLPLSMIGGLVWFLARRARRIAREATAPPGLDVAGAAPEPAE